MARGLPAQVEAVLAEYRGREWDGFEDLTVPALVAPFAAALVESVGLGPGDRLLDAGCGTGAVVRGAIHAGVDPGDIHGVDIEGDALDVARHHCPAAVRLRLGSLTDLPYSDATFDVVACHQTLQHVDQRQLAVAEMARVLIPGGRLAVGCWGPVRDQVPFRALRAALAQVGSPMATTCFGAASSLSDTGDLHDLLTGAGFADVSVSPIELALRDSPASLLAAYAAQSELVQDGLRALTPDQQATLVETLCAEMPPCAGPDEVITMHMVSNIAVGQVPAQRARRPRRRSP